MALPSVVRALPQETEKPERAGHLTPVTQTRPRRRSPLALALICVVALLGILAMQLWLSLATSAGAYMTDDLIAEERELIRVERTMQQQVELFASPQHLSQEASQLGMVQNARPAYLKLESNALVGELNQQTQAPRKNLVSNAALLALNAPPEAKTDSTPAPVGKPEPVQPSGPVPWEGTLEAPQTR